MTRILVLLVLLAQGMRRALGLTSLPRQRCVHAAACLSPAPLVLKRLGNRLVILGKLLELARRDNLCYVSTQGLLNTEMKNIVRLPKMIDVATGQGVQPSTPVGCTRRTGFYGEYDDWLRELQRLSKASEHLLRCTNSSSPVFGPRGIVMHMRSGDVMGKAWPSGFYPQPPCAFYLRLANQGNGGHAFDSVLIVTEPDRRNPCIKHVSLHAQGKVEVQSRSTTKDACALIQAQNLAMSFGTFGLVMAGLSTRLRDMHVPFGQDKGEIYPGTVEEKWFLRAISERGLPGIVQHVHSFPGYNVTWRSFEDRVRKMVSYLEEDIVERAIPALAAEL